MPRRLALLLVLFLGACGPSGGLEPLTDSRLPPGVSTLAFPPRGWAWGLVQVGDLPPQRYGVSSPRTAPTAHILILPGYGESAEAWFETAADLNRRGYAAWVLDGAGQGGSGRFAQPRDVGHLPSIEADLAGVKAMIRTVIPQDGAPVIVLGQQSGGMLAVLAASRDLGGDGVIISGPWPAPSPGAVEQAMSRVGLGWLRDPRLPAWSREVPYRTGPVGGSVRRSGVQQAWQLANPDLRLGGPSIGRTLVEAGARSDALAALPGLQTPVLLIGAETPVATACARNTACRAAPRPPGARGPYFHLDADGPRGAWLAQVDGFVRERRSIAPSAQAPAPAHGE